MLNAQANAHMVRTKLTQAEAARAAGTSRTSIWRMIKQGRLSAERSDGAVHIDASELLRLFPQANLERAHERSESDTLNVRERPDDGELRALRAHIEELQADKRHLRDELDRTLERAADERTRFLSMIEQKDRLLSEQLEQVRLLTDLRTPKKSWWRKLW
jgi:hypothetical protein